MTFRLEAEEPIKKFQPTGIEGQFRDPGVTRTKKRRHREMSRILSH
jgi:hypothetical protein